MSSEFQLLSVINLWVGERAGDRSRCVQACNSVGHKQQVQCLISKHYHHHQ